MASRAGQKVAVESDFLFGLRKSDSRHENVIAALRKHREGNLVVTLLSSAVLEVRAVLYSRGIRHEGIEETFSLMAALLAEYDVEELSALTLGDVVVAERMRGDLPNLTFFDSLHAATSKRLGMTILSSEGFYERLGLPTMDLDKLR